MSAWIRRTVLALGANSASLKGAQHCLDELAPDNFRYTISAREITT